jgi:hypothetical protein
MDRYESGGEQISEITDFFEHTYTYACPGNLLSIHHDHSNSLEEEKKEYTLP